MIHYIGMDCHRKTIRACRRTADGTIVDEVDLAATYEAIEAYAATHLAKKDAVAFESSFYSRAVARCLAPLVGRVVVSNPMLTKAIAQSKKKTDKVDARVLSDLLRLDYLPQVWLPDEQTEQRRDLCSRRCSLINERTRIKNRIHSVVAGALIPMEFTDLFGKAGLEWLQNLNLKEDERGSIESDQRLMAALEVEIDVVEARMAKNAWNDPRVKLLMTLPGVNIAVAEMLLAAIGYIERFPSPDHLASYLGLVPSVHQSGEHCYYGPITRHGNGKARWMLIQAAQHIATHHGPLGAACRRLLKKKNRNVAVVACARKLAVIAWHRLKINEPYRYAQPLPTQQKLAKLRTRATNERLQGGPKKGSVRSATWGTGIDTRKIPSLPDIYEHAGIPATTTPEQLTTAERRMLNELGVTDYVASIQKNTAVQTKHVPRTTDGSARAKPKSGSRMPESEDAATSAANAK